MIVVVKGKLMFMATLVSNLIHDVFA